jgi:hypothetical protein
MQSAKYDFNNIQIFVTLERALIVFLSSVQIIEQLVLQNHLAKQVIRAVEAHGLD